MRIELCPLGIEWVDGLTGGIPIRQTSIVVGGPRSGRTCFAMGFVIQALERGGVCVVTSDTPESLLDFSRRHLDRDFQPDLQLSKLSILSLAPFLESKLRSLGSPDAPLTELGKYVASKNAQFLVIDSIDAFVSWAGPGDQKRVVRALCAGLQRTSATVLMTVSSTSPALDALEAEVSGSFHLAQEGAQRTLAIRSASWCRTDSAPVGFELVERRGIRVVAATRRLPDQTDVIQVGDMSRVVDSLPPIQMTRRADPEVTDVLPAVPKASGRRS